MNLIRKHEVREAQGHCGVIRNLVADGPARIIHLISRHAKRHYHRYTTEYYYVLRGNGKLFLGGDILDIREGDLIRIDPNVVHQTMEQNEPLEILVIEVPPAIDDVVTVAE